MAQSQAVTADAPTQTDAPALPQSRYEGITERLEDMGADSVRINPRTGSLIFRFKHSVPTEFWHALNVEGHELEYTDSWFDGKYLTCGIK